MTPFVMPSIEFLGLVPLFILVGGALAVLLLDAFVPRTRPYLGYITLVLLTLVFAITCRFLGGAVPAPVEGMYQADDYAHAFDLIFYLAAAAAVALSFRWLEDLDRGEYYGLMLFSTAGMVTLAHATNLVTVFIGLELLSIALYALTGFLHDRKRAAEAALKYFFLGAFASSFLVYGIALVYGATGTFVLSEISVRAAAGTATGGSLTLAAGVGLVLIGFCFKISSVPFHMWTPDVYEGAPTPVAVYMSVGTKAAAFAAMLRIFASGFAPLADLWMPAVAGIALATMLVGNLTALRQLNLKRMLAFSSVAHAGYALVGLLALDNGGGAAVIFYLFAYAAMNLGAFGMVAALEKDGEGLYLRDLGGLAERRPFAAAAMALFMLSLAGVPPTAGFLGKFTLFMSAVDAGWVKLAVVAVVFSTVAAYYYLRVVVTMYMVPEPTGGRELSVLAPGARVVLIASVLGVVGLGLAPDFFLELFRNAVAAI